MPTTFANTINSNPIYADRAEHDASGNTISTTYATKSEVTTGLASKQDTISDLATIRSGAADGATAVQPGDLATVATSGSYNDLSNTPTIPAAQVNSDWNASSGVAEILNKPTILPYKPVVAGTGVRIVDDTANNRIVVEADETVLWSNTSGKTPGTSGDFPITLSEAISNFETVKFYWQTFNDSYQNHTVSEKMTDLSTFVLEGYIYNSANDNGYSILWALSVSGTSLSHVACKYNNWSNNTVSGGAAFVRLYKVVGINRIASN